MKKNRPPSSEEKLIMLAQKNRKDFKPLYEKYFDKIFWFVLKRMGNEALTGDLTQQVFFKAMVNLHQYKFQGHPFSSWLYRIALNEVNQYYRKTKNRRYVELEEGQLSTMVQEMEGKESSEMDPGELLPKLLSLLSLIEVDLVEMKYFEGKSFREIGEILSLKEGAVKVRMHRIMKKLRKAINSVSN